jgi:sigma-B regulation protein RsbU (phosphoserine phosphatase)
MPLAHLWSLTGWSALSLICLALAVYFYANRHGVRIRMHVRYASPPVESMPLSETILGGVSAILTGIVLYHLAAGHGMALRLIWAVAGSALLVAAGFWAWAAVREFSSARTSATRHWQGEAAEACRQIREWMEAPAVRVASCRALSEGLQTNDVRLFLREERNFKAAYDTSGRDREPREYAPDAPLPKILDRLSPGEVFAFQDDGSRLAVPVAAGRALDGFFLVTGGPYTLPMQRFAAEIARETARALAVSDLTAKQAEVRAASQIERRELDNTRRALQHLVAPDLPSIAGLDYAAEYWRGDRPGGQFLDLIALPQGALGLVLADLPGFGLDAAIRMAQLQTLLRSRFWAYAEDLPELLQSTERALRASRPASGQVRVFLGRYQANSRTLTYLNAGMLAPLLIRRGGEGAQVLRLPPTAPPMVSGSSEGVHTADLILESGDLLSAFNAGLVEAFDGSGEAWGEGRLIQTMLAWETQRAADLVSLTLRTVEEHTAHNLSSPDRAMILVKAV